MRLCSINSLILGDTSGEVISKYSLISDRLRGPSSRYSKSSFLTPDNVIISIKFFLTNLTHLNS